MSVTIKMCPVVGEHKAAMWAEFKDYHYAPNVFNKAAECYLVAVQGKWVAACGLLCAVTKPPER